MAGEPGDPQFVAITGGDGRLQAAVGRDALEALIPYRKQLPDGAPWHAAFDVVARC